MQDLSWLKPTKSNPTTEASKAAFRLARADQAENQAKEWEARGDEEQARRWRETAKSLRQ